MYRKKDNAVRETHSRGATEAPTDTYKASAEGVIGLLWESEGHIVPIEGQGQHNPT